MVDFAYLPYRSPTSFLLLAVYQSVGSCLSAFVHAIPSAKVFSPTCFTHLENYCLSLNKGSKVFSSAKSCLI